jgi:hypothetical protein
MVGWIQSNKRWDILTSMWEDIHAEILARSGHNRTFWPWISEGSNHLSDFNHCEQLKVLEGKGLAHYFEFVPRGEIYYKVMAVCDFIVLPSTDETQSGTLANYCTQQTIYNHGPNGGLTAQALESGGGLLFTNKMLKDEVIAMACNEDLRLRLGKTSSILTK